MPERPGWHHRAGRLIRGLAMLFCLFVFASPRAELQLDPQAARSGRLAPLEYLYDASGAHGIAEVLSLHAPAWKPVGNSGASFGYDDGHYWFRWHLLANRERAPEQYFIEIAYPLLDEIELFAIRTKAGTPKVIQQWRLGDKLPFDARPFSHRNFVVPFTAEPESETEFIAHVHTTSAVQVPVRIWNSADFQSYNQISLIANGTYIGIMLSVILYNLVLWLTMQERMYFYFVLWVICALLTVVIIEGLAFQYLWPNLTRWNDQALVVFLLLGAASAIVFSSEFMRPELEERSPTSYLDKIVFGISIPLILLSFLIPYRVGIALGMLLVPFSILVSLAYGIGAALRGQPQGRLFVTGFVGVLIVIAMVILGKFSLLATTIVSDSLIKMAFGVEVVLVSLSLAMRLSEEHRLRAEAQQALIDVHQQACNQLEQHVAERTRELETANRELSRLSMTDALTGLPNRRYFDEIFIAEASRAASAGRPFSMAMIDVDHFKNFNDTHGHAAGDICLRAVAQELRRQVPRNADLIARYGGEEFCILMPNTDTDGAMIVAERIRLGIQRIRIDLGKAIVGVTVSIGVNTIRPGEIMSEMHTLVEAADRALYHAKQLGRNRVVEACALL